MLEEFIAAIVVVLAVIAVVAAVRFLGKTNRVVADSTPKGPDPGGTFGGIPNIAPGVFNPGSVPPPTFEVTEHVRAYDQQIRNEPLRPTAP